MHVILSSFIPRAACAGSLCTDELVELAVRCVAAEPTARPAAAVVAEELGWICQKLKGEREKAEAAAVAVEAARWCIGRVGAGEATVEQEGKSGEKEIGNGNESEKRSRTEVGREAEEVAEAEEQKQEQEPEDQEEELAMG